MKQSVKVESPSMNVQRKGRGFSREELSAAKVTITEAREAGLIVDKRRKSKYKENVDSLKEFKKEFAKIEAEREKELIKIRKLNAKARKTAQKRKAETDAEYKAKLEEIEKEKLRVQEEIAKREAEELEAAEAEELTEDELAELDDLEAEGSEDDLSEEEALEQIEGDLAESLGEDEEKAKTITTPEGATKVVKRVRKKPTETKAGATSKAEKKE